MRACFLLLFLFLLPSPASAWDQSVLSDVRFSSNGRYFSFVEHVESEAEQHGYATMYLIDTAKDAWILRTPLRVVLNGEGASGKAALAEVRRKGTALVERFGLTDAGAASLPFLEVDRADPYRRRQVADLSNPSGRLELLERKAASAHSCTADTPVADDFRLVFLGQEMIVLEDYAGKLPCSRGCANGYDIAAAFVHKADGRTVLAVLVGVYTPGWEGSDRHLIAVTKVLP